MPSRGSEDLIRVVSVRRYIKQRATLEKINGAIDEIAQVLTDKHKITSQAFSKLTGPAVKKYKVPTDPLRRWLLIR